MILFSWMMILLRDLVPMHMNYVKSCIYILQNEYSLGKNDVNLDKWFCVYFVVALQSNKNVNFGFSRKSKLLFGLTTPHTLPLRLYNLILKSYLHVTSFQNCISLFRTLCFSPECSNKLFRVMWISWHCRVIKNVAWAYSKTFETWW